MYYIYRITNTINGKIYIGKAKNWRSRWCKHQSAAKLKTTNDYFYLHRAINKHGAENFLCEAIAICETEKAAMAAEIHYIKMYSANSRKIGYNLTKGGDGTSGRVVSLQTRKKLRIVALGKKASPEAKKKMSEARKGSKRSELTKQKMREARAKQTPMSDETCAKISKAHTGKTLSEEHKQAIRNNVPNRKVSEEQVLSIIEMLNSRNSSATIARQFGLSEAVVFGIKTGKKWARLFHLVKVSIRPKIDWPPYEELIAMVAASNYSEVGRLLGATGAGVKKRIKRYEQELLTRSGNNS